MPPQFILMLAAFAGISVVFFLIARQIEKNRTDGIRRAAEELGFDFVGNVPGTFVDSFPPFGLFRRTRSRKIWNFLRRAADGREVRIFDYRYRVGSGKNSSVVSQTVIAISVDQHTFPDMTLAPEGFFSRVASALGAQDIDFETAPEFSRTFVLKGDPATVRDYLDGADLEQLVRFRGVSIETKDNMIVIWFHNSRRKPAEIREFLETAFEILLVLTRTR